MGRRDIIITGLFGLVAIAGGSVVTAFSMTVNAYTPALRGFGLIGLLIGLIGLAYMFRTAPKGLLQAAQDAVTPREFLADDITPGVLRAKVEGRTSLQIDALTKTYAGKWMKVSGRVYDVSQVGGGSYKSIVVHIADDGDGALIFLVFEQRWLEQLSALNKGDWLAVEGKIERLHNGPSLCEAEIMHMGEPPKPKPAQKPRAPRKKAAPTA